MGCGAYVFLNRSIAKDQKVLELLIKYYKDSHCNYQVCCCKFYL